MGIQLQSSIFYIENLKLDITGSIIFSPKCTKTRLAAGLPLGELTALPHTSNLDLGEGREKGKGRRREGKGGERGKGEERGKGGKYFGPLAQKSWFRTCISAVRLLTNQNSRGG